LGRQGVSPWLSVGPGAAEGARLPPMVADSDPARVEPLAVTGALGLFPVAQVQFIE